jgi:hypothetical protein
MVAAPLPSPTAQKAVVRIMRLVETLVPTCVQVTPVWTILEGVLVPSSPPPMSSVFTTHRRARVSAVKLIEEVVEYDAACVVDTSLADDFSTELRGSGVPPPPPPPVEVMEVLHRGERACSATTGVVSTSNPSSKASRLSIDPIPSGSVGSQCNPHQPLPSSGPSPC